MSVLGSRSGLAALRWPGRRDGQGGSLLRKLTQLVVVAARSLSNWPILNTGHHLLTHTHTVYKAACIAQARGARTGSAPRRASAYPDCSLAAATGAGAAASSLEASPPDPLPFSASAEPVLCSCHCELPPRAAAPVGCPFSSAPPCADWPPPAIGTGPVSLAPALASLQCVVYSRTRWTFALRRAALGAPRESPVVISAGCELSVALFTHSCSASA